MKHTPGPWFADDKGNVWRRPPSELYHNGGGVAGDKPIATVNAGWYAPDNGYPVEANARLIAAAPELLYALINLEHAVDLPSDSPSLADLRMAARFAITKATGEIV